MCGRTACALAPDDVIKACSYRDRHGKCQRPTWINAPGGQQFTPAYNIAPGAFTPVLLSAKHLSLKSGQPSSPSGVLDRVVMPMKWGLVPPWHHGDPFKVPYETNNCRAEGMLEKKTYKVPLARGNRCVILADGFFEWKSCKDGKQPYYFYFPQDNLKLSIKKEDNEYTYTKPVKTEKLENMTVMCAGETFYSEFPHQDCKDKLYLGGLGDKSCVELSVNNNLAETNFCVQKKEVGLSYGGTKKISSSGNCDLPVPFGNSPTNTPTKSGSLSDLVKQENTGDSRTDMQTTECREMEEKKVGVTSQEGPRLLTMAGVFDIWKADEHAAPIYSYSVITVSSSKDMDWCHHRMPAILSTEDEVQNWLDFSSLPLSKAVQLIKPKVCLSHHAVSKQVNSSRYQAANSVKPVQIGQPVATPGSKLMKQWLQSGSPGKRKLQDLSAGADSKSGVMSSQSSVSKKRKDIGKDNLMMRWLKSGSPLKKN
ncbi:embryonic stem cell-specific 5-hydroxymethylcytosine-binding protein-like [Elysia marginata]|uniref:Abasic site processing protein HMCES n=1 Tax=Elysia marginata TaxID=1093978 RepID=A0AAV4G1H5_9GAST|nr:embryonic stem cell-specific 5-hydroxymethylcytosine-binding protein-like [Elysia marginata]